MDEAALEALLKLVAHEDDGETISLADLFTLKLGELLYIKHLASTEKRDLQDRATKQVQCMIAYLILNKFLIIHH